MTEPGGSSSGVSWIDVAASAKGIESSFRAIGTQAANATAESFNTEFKTRMASAGQSGAQALASAMTPHLGAAGHQAVGAFTQAVDSELGNRMRVSGQAGGSILGSGLAEGLGQHLAGAFGPLQTVVSKGLKSIGIGSSGEAGAAGEAVGGAMAAGMVGAVILGAKGVVDNFKNVVKLVDTEAAAFGKVGEDAAHTLMDSFASTVEGKGPDISAAFSVVTEGVETGLKLPLNVAKTEIENTVGRIPLIGSAFTAVGEQATSALEGVFGAFGEFTELGGELLETLTAVGDKWSDMARTVAGQTLGTDGLSRYMDAIKAIGASGAVEDLKDVADSIGLLGQRLSDLNDGAGLTQQQLQELATTFAQGEELLGYKLNVDAVTSALNDFEIPADQVNDTLLTLVNTARLTGSNFNDLMGQVSTGGPVFQSLGYDLAQTTFVLGRINEELGPGAANRWVMGIANAEEKAHRLGLTWHDVMNVLNDYIKAGDKAGAVDYLKGLGMGAKVVQTTIDEISKGILVLPNQVQQAIDQVGPALHEPLDDVLTQTEDLGQRWEQIGGQMLTALAPLGEGITNSLGTATASIGTWISQNQAEIVGFVGRVVDFFATGFEHVATIVADLLKITAPVIEIVQAVVEHALGTVLGGIEAVTGALTHLPIVGDKFKDAHKAAGDALGALHDLDKVDLGHWATVGGDALDHFANDVLPGWKSSWDTNVTKAEDIDPIGEAFKRNFLDPTQGQTAPALQNAFKATKDGIDLLGKPDTWAAVHDQLQKLGIDLQFDQGGKVTGITAQNQAEAQALKDWWTEQFGPDHPLPVQVQVQPPTGADWWRHIVPSSFTTSTDSGITIPANIDVKDGPVLEPAGMITKAGIGSKYQGDIPASGEPGVLLPTAFDVKDGEQKSLSDLMEAVGIPDANQGDDGVTLDVSFNTSAGAGAGAAGAVPASFTGGAGGPVDATAQQAAQLIIQQAQQRGFSPEATQAILSTALQESGLSESAVGGGGAWHGIFQQDSVHPNRDSASGNISGFFDRLGPPSGDIWSQIFGVQQGTPYNSPGARKGYMGEIQSHLSQAQQLYGQITSGGGSGGGGGMPGASTTYSPDWLLSHGIAPIFHKSPNDPGGAASPGEIPSWVYQLGGQFGLTPKDHGDRTLHGGIRGPRNTTDPTASWAFDFFGAPENMQRFADYLSQNYASQLVQLIHQDPATGRDTGVAGGQRLAQGQYFTTKGGSYADESDEVHVAFASPISTATNATNTVVPADYTPGGATPATFVDNTTTGGTPGDPQTPAPTAPGSSYGSIPPPPGMTPAPPGTPGAIHTPYGDFVYTWQMSPDQQAKLTPEQKKDFDPWLQKFERSQEQQTSTQTEIDTAQTDVTDKKAKKDAADAALQAAQATEPPGMSDADRQAWEKSNADFIKAQTEATAADKEYTEATTRLTTAQRRQHDEQISSQIESEEKPPWESSKASTEKPDKNAEDLGKGLVSGVLQELGFPDVFGKGPTQWGITKLLSGIGGFALGKLGQLADGQGGQGGAGGSSPSITADSGLLGVLESIIPGLKHPNQLGGDGSSQTAPPAPTDASQTPAPTDGSGAAAPQIPLPAPPSPAPPPAAAPPAPATPPTNAGAPASPNLPPPPAPSAGALGLPKGDHWVEQPSLGAGPPPRVLVDANGVPIKTGPGHLGGAPAAAPPAPAPPPPAPPAPNNGNVWTAAYHPPAGSTAQHLKPATWNGPAANWLTPGTLNPGLHMASPAQKVDGTSDAIIGMFSGMAGMASPKPPQTAPAPASDTAAAVGSVTPPPPTPPPDSGNGITYNSPLNVTVNHSGFTPAPQVVDTVRDISHMTAAPQLAGGQGVLL
jgi:hypothetical protein